MSEQSRKILISSDKWLSCSDSSVNLFKSALSDNICNLQTSLRTLAENLWRVWIVAHTSLFMPIVTNFNFGFRKNRLIAL